jgi:predicted nuclease of predicted toxin-antitoxin system
MATFLANENVPGDAVAAARQADIDLVWIKELAAGADDDAVLAMSVAGNRVLVTFDKDFGELAFRKGRNASCGVILLRPRLRSPDFLAQFLVAVLTQQIDWEGHFAVAREGRIRVIRLPE